MRVVRLTGRIRGRNVQHTQIKKQGTSAAAMAKGKKWGLALVLATAALSATGQTKEQPDNRFEASLADMQRAEADYTAKRWQQALADYDALVRAHPKNPFLLYRYGNVASQLGMYENAAQAYQTALVHDPNYAEAAYNLGLVRLLQSDSAFAHAAEHAGNNPQFAEDAKHMREISQRIIRVSSASARAPGKEPDSRSPAGE